MQLTLTHILTNALRRHQANLAVRIGANTWTYDDLDRLSTHLAGNLQKAGIRQTDRIALYLRNCIEYVIADLAIIKLGAVKIPLNQFQSANDVEFVLDETGASTLIAHHSLLNSLTDSDAITTSLKLILCVDDGGNSGRKISGQPWESFIEPSEIAIPQVKKDDVALITYTGGTTGKPKGVVQTQASLAINLLSHVLSSELSPDEIMLLMTPLPHSAGYHLQSCLLHGGVTILTDGFSPEIFFNQLTEFDVTWTFLVPTMIYRLLDDPRPYDKHTSSLESIVYGAAPMSTERLKEALEKFGPIFIQLYGQTEAPNYITALTKSDHLNEHLHRSCGRPVAMAEIQTSADDGQSTGEILVQTPYLLSAYYKNESATNETLRHGWLHTGDIGYIDDEGYLFLQDRTKDMIISGGMNVYSIEVEQELKAHPMVSDAAVIGLPHADWGEQVHAVVVAHEPLDARVLIEHCRRNLSRYKVPKSIEFRNVLPLTAYGKIDKKTIKEQHQT